MKLLVGCLLVLFTLSTMPPAALAAEEPDKIKLMTKLAKLCWENERQIKTWQGKVRETYTLSDEKELVGGKLVCETEAVIEFAFDRLLRAKRFKSNYKTIYHHVDGEEKKRSEYSVVGLEKGESYIELTVIDDTRGVAKLYDSMGGSSDALRFDATEYHRFLGSSVPECLLGFAQHDAQRVKRNIDPVWMVVQYPDQVQVLADTIIQNFHSYNDYRISPDHGNLLGFYSNDPNLEYAEKRQFKKIDGIWLPIRVEIERHDPIKKRKSRRVITWEEQQLNSPIDPKSFTRDAIGIRETDQIVDKRESDEVKIEKVAN